MNESIADRLRRLDKTYHSGEIGKALRNSEPYFPDLDHVLHALPAILRLIDAAQLVLREGTASGLDKTMGLYELAPALRALTEPQP